MDLILILALGLAIGAVLGSLGGGGAVLTVPALVYVLGQTAQDATTSSLLIVGLSALVGVLGYISAQRVRWRLGLGFALAGTPATWAGTYANHRVDPNLLLLGFSAVMTVAAAALLADRARSAPGVTATPAPAVENHGPEPTSGTLLVDEQTRVQAETVIPHTSMLPVVVTGLLVGLLTGFFGVGGGFVIVPVLVLVLRLPMQQAVGTSLLIVALNSATSLGARAGAGGAHFDWAVIVPFTGAAMLATLAGRLVADRLPAARLKVGFAALLIVVAGGTAWQSVEGMTLAPHGLP